ncbi:UpxY family transcription antiterminator [Puteibacter caeruleilacunae]|nr:UpxY family transcription antiterminator [Puteibacter caeruleilacunae]
MPWYAIYTKSRAEKKVHKALTEQGIEAYVPLQKKLKQWSDRKKWVDTPVINGYVFVKVSPKQRLQVLQTPNVVMFVRYQRQDAVIPDRQMDAMKSLLGQMDFEVEFSSDDLKQGDKMIINSGALMGLVGELVEIKGKKRVAIRIEQLGGHLNVDIPITSLERITEEQIEALEDEN